MNRIGIITGAGGGVGRATAERFARDGWSLVLTDMTGAILTIAEDVGKGAQGRVIGVQADIATTAGVEAIDAAARSLDGPLTSLCLVAGTLQQVVSIENLDMAEWDRVMAVNLRANVLMIKQFIPELRRVGGASIVTVSSWFGHSGHGLFSAYCASKAGLISLTQSVAAELAVDKIRVNSVAPGNIATSMHFTALREEADKRGITAEAMQKFEWDKIPMGRAAEPAEIAAAIAFLASPDSTYITGATIDVNGGVLFA